MLRILPARTIGTFALLLATAATTAAQPTLTGIRASITGTEWDGTVDLDVTLYTTPIPGYPTYSTGFLGDRYSGSATFLGYTTLLYYRILDPSIPAIDWGDGAILDNTTVPMVSSGPPRTYRGSFRHTYPDPSVDHTIRVGAHGYLGYPDGGAGDNPRLPPVAGNAIYVDSVRSYMRRTYVGDGTFAGTSTIAFDNPFAVGITNTVVAAASLFPDPPPIPSATYWGLVVLSLALGSGGALLLRH